MSRTGHLHGRASGTHQLLYSISCLSAYVDNHINAGVVAYMGGIVGYGGPREDAVLIDQAIALALGRRIRAAFDVTIKAGNDVAEGRALEILGLLL